MAQFTAFGKEVKKKLVDIDHTQAWLIEQVRGRTGLYLDYSIMTRCPSIMIEPMLPHCVGNREAGVARITPGPAERSVAYSH